MNKMKTTALTRRLLPHARTHAYPTVARVETSEDLKIIDVQQELSPGCSFTFEEHPKNTSSHKFSQSGGNRKWRATSEEGCVSLYINYTWGEVKIIISSAKQPKSHLCTCNPLISMVGFTELVSYLVFIVGWHHQWSTRFFGKKIWFCHQIILEEICCLWIDLDFYIWFSFISFLSYRNGNKTSNHNVIFQMPNEGMNEWRKKTVSYLVGWLKGSMT